jgi:hypothetical protein
MSKISLFPEGKVSQKTGKLSPSSVPFTNVEFLDYLNNIKDGEFQDEVLAYRTGKLEKLKLRGVTPSGVFSYRTANNLVQHSGFIAIDIDSKDQTRTDFNTLRTELTKDPYTFSLHDSVSGNGGLVVYVKIVAEKHYDSFISLEKYYLDNYKVIIDASGKDVCRFRFVSYDPETYINQKSKTWKSYLKKAQIEPRVNYVFSNGDLDHVFQQIADKGIDLTNDYHEWYKIGGALENHYGGQKGLDFFHLVSQNSAKYDSKAVDDLYRIIERRKSDKIATIGTFLWICRNNGIETKTQRTEHIERISKVRRKSVGTNGGAKDSSEAKKDIVKTLELENISGDDVTQIVEQVFSLPESELKVKSNDVLADLKAFLKAFDLKFNEITRNYELKGEPMTDRDYNSIYIKAIEQVDEKVTKDRLFSLIDSDNTNQYSPFIEFINKYKHLKPSGNFEKLCSCFDYKQITYANGTKQEVDDYLEIFLKKWLMGIISSMHGTYSILILVLTGGQRAGKTKFFRNLLPDELMTFYAESKLDEGKDSEILMTKKLIILDDEFGGKSKQDAKRLKELSSKQWFNLRRPFGRTSEDLRRLAVLCGTSNDEEVINDPTGNRRILPINVLDIDHEKMQEINKIDLFIEIYNEWIEDKDAFMLTKEEIEILNNCTSMNEQPSQEEEMILKYFVATKNAGGNTVFLTNTEIKAFIEEKHSTIRLNPYKLGLTLKKLGFEKQSKRVGGSAPKIVYLLEYL